MNKKLIFFGATAVLTVIGAVLTSIGLAKPNADVISMCGMLLVVTGSIVLVFGLPVGFLIDALRKPSQRQLAQQQLDNRRTWHIRPLGLCVFIAAFGAFGMVYAWLSQQNPALNIKIGRRPIGVYLFASLFVVSFSFRPIRDFVFYTDEIPD